VTGNGRPERIFSRSNGGCHLPALAVFRRFDR
jgi:hypothetical protein